MAIKELRPISILIGSLTIFTLLSGCASSKPAASESPKAQQATSSPSTTAAAAAASKVKYAITPGIPGLAARYGVEKGFFAEEGLDVQIVDAQDPAASVTSGEVDIADISTTTAIVAAGKGAPFKIVSSMFRTKGPYYLLAKNDIKSVEELKGKKVGGGVFGTGLDAYTQVILKKHGLSKNDVTYIANGFQAAAYASFEAGQVDATIIHEPFLSLAEKNKIGKLLVKGWDYLPTFHTGVIIAGNKVIEKNPELVEKTLKAYFKSQEYAKNNQKEYLDYVAKSVKVDRDVLEKGYKQDEVLWENKPEVDLKALNDTQQTQIDLGFQDKLYDVSKILDLRFIPKK